MWNERLTVEQWYAMIPAVEQIRRDSVCLNRRVTIPLEEFMRVKIVLSERLLAEDDDPMWMSKLAPKLKKGQLHRDLGVPEDETIPTSALRAATAKGGKVAQRANFALRARGL